MFGGLVYIEKKKNYLALVYLSVNSTKLEQYNLNAVCSQFEDGQLNLFHLIKINGTIYHSVLRIFDRY